MTKEEFIKAACSLGYCDATQAEEYCKGRTIFTEDDFIGVYRKINAPRYIRRGRSLGNGSYTTKRYLRNGEDNR